jgi:peptidoglycan/xylan/chitin deacetylase (PgdA/CDA1 family)
LILSNAKYFVKNGLQFVAKHLPLNTLIALSGQKLILPFYHTISDNYVPHIHHLYKVRNTRLFRQDLEFFLKHYKAVSLEALNKNIKSGKEIKSNAFFLSFDDGLREVYDVIAPILKEKGISATFFVNPGFIDNKDLFFRYKASLLIDHLQKTKNVKLEVINKLSEIWPGMDVSQNKLQKIILNVDYANKETLNIAAEILGVDFNEYLQKQRPYLTTIQLKELQKDGFSIGAHSMDHPLYNSISLEEQLRQTKESIIFVKENYNPEISSFAFPFTDFGVKADFFKTIFSPGNKIADITFGTAGIKLEKDFPFHLQRIPIEHSQKSAKEIIATEYLYYLLKKPLGKNTIIREP